MHRVFQKVNCVQLSNHLHCIVGKLLLKMCWGGKGDGIWWCGVGGQSANLLILRQRHWSCIKDGLLRSSHCITMQGYCSDSHYCSLIHCRSEVKEVEVEERWPSTPSPTPPHPQEAW